MIHRSRTFVLCCALAIPSLASGQVVELEESEFIREQDLLAGEFNGQLFTLGPQTVFRLNFGSYFNEIGSEDHNRSFDMRGSRVEVRNGGTMLGRPSWIRNVGITLFDGGSLRDVRVFGQSSVTIHGGSAERFTVDDDSVLNMLGGTSGLVAQHGGLVNVLGGVVREDARADGGRLNILGGVVEDLAVVTNSGSILVSRGELRGGLAVENYSRFTMDGGSITGGVTLSDFARADITGGRIGRGFTAGSGASLLLDGGSVGPGFDVSELGEDFELIGGEFRINGDDVTGISGGFSGDDIFTGVLRDGSVFIFSESNGDRVPFNLTHTHVPAPDANFRPIVVSSGEGPSGGLRQGQSLTLSGSGVFPHSSAAVGAQIFMDGGTVGDDFEAAYSTIQQFGGAFGKNATLYSGTFELNEGVVGDGFTARSGAAVLVVGGDIGDGARFTSGSTLALDGGSLGDSATFDGSGHIRFRGGTVGSDLSITGLPSLEISGGTFGDNLRVSGTEYVPITGGRFLGRVVFEESKGVEISGGAFDTTVTIGTNALARITTTEPVDRIRAEGNGHALVRAGEIREIDVVGTAHVDFEGGVVRHGIEIDRDASATVSGGLLRGTSEVSGQITIAGDSVIEELDIEPGGMFVMTGGLVSEQFQIRGDQLNVISGGRTGERFFMFNSSRLRLRGADFRLNGEAVTEFPDGLDAGDLFTATLEDGSALIWRGEKPGPTDRIVGFGSTLEVVDVPAVSLTPIVVSEGVAPATLRPGQSLTLDGGVIPGSPRFIGATVTINGGEVGRDLAALETSLTITGGTIGTSLQALPGSSVSLGGDATFGTIYASPGVPVSVTGGTFYGDLLLEGDNKVTITGGESISTVHAGPGSRVAISGGLHSALSGDDGAVFRISGGRILGLFTGFAGSEFHFEVLEASLNGDALNLDLFVPLTIDQRDGSVLEYVLADGTRNAIWLVDIDVPSPPYGDRFDASSLITLTRVPAPGAIGLLGIAGLVMLRRRPGRS